MYIKLKNSALASFSGWFCGIEFRDGVTIDHASKRDYQRISAITDIETFEDDCDKEPEKGGSNEEPQTPAPQSHQTAPPSEEPVAIYTREELEAIADKQGIAGLREIADKHQVKARSIAELIDELVLVKG